MVLKICWMKMYDRNLGTRLSQVKIPYGMKRASYGIDLVENSKKSRYSKIST